MAINTDCLQERLPAQDLTHLSSADPTPRSVAAWVAGLPLVNTGESVPLMFRMLQELVRLNTPEPNRFLLLESVREPAHVLGNALAKHYLNNTLVLAEAAAKVATLAQAMQYHLANGYKRVVVNTLAAPPPPPKQAAAQRDMLALAMHRAMKNLLGALLRVTELYLSPPPGLWLEMHCLYRLAIDQGLANIKMANPGSALVKQCSIEELYIRALLLATCNPNKLRQGEIRKVYDLTGLWAPLVTLIVPSASSNSPFVYDLCMDESPANRSARGDRAPETVRTIDSLALLHRLQGLAGQQPHPKDTGEASLHATLADHLMQSWTSMLSERSSARNKHETSLELCIGLMATHYHLGNQQDFHSQMRGRFELVSIMENAVPQAGGNHHKSFTAYTSDISAGGYGISWDGEVPVLLKVGELVGVREPDHEEWSIGVIRWVRQVPGRGAQMGLEVLAPRATPCGTRMVKSWEEEASDYLRTLIVPGLKALNRPATLITPNVSFQPGNRISIMRNGKEEKARLVKLYSAAHSFRQFEFQIDDGSGEPPA
jgi:hypothetical protein